MNVLIYRIIFIAVSLFFFLPICVFGQVSGFVTDSAGAPLPRATLLLKSSSSQQILGYTLSKDNGAYSLELPKYTGRILLEVRFLGFLSDSLEITLPSEKLPISHDFRLLESKRTLKALEVTSTAPIKKLGEDTVSYDAGSFTNGSEEVIGEVLNKIPGITVNEDGKVSYRGKPIKKLLIEGADLFDQNYGVATKNLGAEVVKSIEAISHYQENKQLQGIEQTEDVALNIRLKDDVKSKPYGKASLDYGSNYEASIDALAVNKKLKYYTLGKANNTGLNLSFYDPISRSTLKGLNMSNGFVNIEFFRPEVVQEHGNINQAALFGLNMTYKHNERLNGRLNISGELDRQRFERQSFQEYAGDVAFQENALLELMPESLAGDFMAIYEPTANTSIQYKVKGGIEKEVQHNTRLVNGSELLETLTDRPKYLDQSLVYSHKIDSSSALILEGYISYVTQPQYYELRSANEFEWIVPTTSLSLNGLLSQEAYSNQRLMGGKSRYIKKKSRAGHYAVYMEYKQTKANLTSDLIYRQPSDTLSLAVNTHQQAQNIITGGFSNQHVTKNGLLGIKYKLEAKNQSLSVNQARNTYQVSMNYLEPSITVGLRMNEKIRIGVNYLYSQEYPTANELYSGFILRNYQMLTKGVSDPISLNRHFSSLFLNYLDIYKQQSISIIAVYQKQDQAYGSSVEISDMLQVSSGQVLPGTKSYSINGEANKFIPFLLTNLKVQLNYNQSEYFNQVNNAEDIRQNQSVSWRCKFLFGTAWSKLLNLATSFEREESRFRTENSGSVSSNIALRGRFSLISKPHPKWKLILRQEYSAFNVGESNQATYYFLNTYLEYKPSKRLSFRLTGDNLFNQTLFTQNHISDFFIMTNEYTLQDRILMFGLSYRF